MFALEISVSLPIVEELKTTIAKSLPSVKSSHRVEAIARGLGFRTYASLLAAARSPFPLMAKAEGSSFANYLSQHRFSGDSTPLYVAVATAAIRDVLSKEPRLSANGFGVGASRRNTDNSWQTPKQRFDQFTAWRDELLGVDAAHQFLRSLVLLQRIPPTKTIRTGAGSYRLKHIAENYVCSFPEGAKLGPHYVSNGALIVAARHLGFRYRTYADSLGYEIPNVTFNMPKTVIDDLDAEIRPRGAVAQDRQRTKEWREQKQSFSNIRRVLANAAPRSL